MPLNYRKLSAEETQLEGRFAVGVDGLAYALDIGRTTAKELLRTRKIRSFHINGRHLTPVSEIAAYMERQMQAEGQ